MQRALDEATAVFTRLGELRPQLEKVVETVLESIHRGGKILTCGNGGSACEAQHLAGELVGRYRKTRRALPAIALTADGSVLSCIGNDFRFDEIFARQIEALATSQDVLLVFSSSGASGNIVEALLTARRMNIRSVGFLGKDGGPALPLCDLAVLAPTASTARAQEAHQFLLHTLMDMVEERLGFATADNLV